MPPPGVRGFFLSRGPGTCKKNASRSHPEKLLQIQTEIQPHTRAPKGYINGADVLFDDHFFYKLTVAEELSSTGHPTEKKPFELGQKKIPPSPITGDDGNFLGCWLYACCLHQLLYPSVNGFRVLRELRESVC
jgi:hypothetical protein